MLKNSTVVTGFSNTSLQMYQLTKMIADMAILYIQSKSFG